MEAFAEINRWVQQRAQLKDHAKVSFGMGADGWLVACFRVYGTTVVTHEESSPQSRNRVLLPDLGTQFIVPCANTFTMLRSLPAQFHLHAKETP